MENGKEKKSGRPKKEESRWAFTYFYERDNRPNHEKKGYYDQRGLIFINYNFHTDMRGDVSPDLNYMQKLLQKRLSRVYKRFIAVYDGGVSKKSKDKFYINAQVSVIVPSGITPTENTFIMLEKLITDVRYEDEKGRNTYNDERLRLTAVQKARGNRKRPIILINISGEETRYTCAREVADKFQISEATVVYFCQISATKMGYTFKYAV